MLFRNVVFLLLLVSTASQASSPLSATSIMSETSRVAAPNFMIDNLRGGEASLVDYSGKLILLNFWATWCMPCREEMPSMEMLWQNYKDQGLVVVAISVDEGSAARVEKFSEIFKLSFPVLLDPESKVNDLYEVSNMPTSFLIDREGRIITRIVGTEDWSSSEAVQLVETLLAQ